MREIVADTAPLNYLVLIEAAGILPRLFASVLIPPAVKKELSHGNAPAAVSTWIANPPSWLKVVNLKTSVAAMFSYLDGGEAEAITLALEQPGTLLLMDDRHGTVEARKRGLEVVGTLAVLDRAAARGWIDLQEMFRRLRASTFRSPLRLMARMLEEDALRNRR
jgi:predicted nucleic acid-binding protein